MDDRLSSIRRFVQPAPCSTIPFRPEPPQVPFPVPDTGTPVAIRLILRLRDRSRAGSERQAMRFIDIGNVDT